MDTIWSPEHDGANMEGGTSLHKRGQACETYLGHVDMVLKVEAGMWGVVHPSALWLPIWSPGEDNDRRKTKFGYQSLTWLWENHKSCPSLPQCSIWQKWIQRVLGQDKRHNVCSGPCNPYRSLTGMEGPGIKVTKHVQENERIKHIQENGDTNEWNGRQYKVVLNQAWLAWTKNFSVVWKSSK